MYLLVLSIQMKICMITVGITRNWFIYLSQLSLYFPFPFLFSHPLQPVPSSHPPAYSCIQVKATGGKTQIQ